MPVLLKCIGSMKQLEIKRNDINVVNLEAIKNVFREYNFIEDEIDKIRFIAKSITLTSETPNYPVSEDENMVVFVFTNDKELKSKLVSFFDEKQENKQENTNDENTSLKREPDERLTKEIEENEVPYKINDELVKEINAKTIKLFEDDDFRKLVKIYYSKPEIFKTFISYMSGGDMINCEISNDEDKIYNEEINILKELGITLSDHEINQFLVKFNGHLNLTLRFILSSLAYREEN